MPFPVDTPDGLFHDGNPATNTPGTVCDAEWLNAVQAAVIAFSCAATSVSATYPITNDDGVVFCDTTSAGFTLTLPVVSGLTIGKRFWIKNITPPVSANTLSLVAADGKTIDGELQLDLMGLEKLEVIFDGVNWQTI